MLTSVSTGLYPFFLSCTMYGSRRRCDSEEFGYVGGFVVCLGWEFVKTIRVSRVPEALQVHRAHFEKRPDFVQDPYVMRPTPPSAQTKLWRFRCGGPEQRAPDLERLSHLELQVVEMDFLREAILHRPYL